MHHSSGYATYLSRLLPGTQEPVEPQAFYPESGTDGRSQRLLLQNRVMGGSDEAGPSTWGRRR